MTVAESGKARYVGVDQLEPGMKVHKEVMGRRGTPLVNAGEVLSRTHIDKLRKWEHANPPAGPTKARLKKGDPIERLPFQGGHRVSDFNPRGILVSATLSSGEDVPAVVADPTKSPIIQNAPRAASVMAPDMGVESPLFRARAIEREIKTLEETNKQLGGTIFKDDKNYAGEKELAVRRDALAKQNTELIEALRNGKSGGTRKKAR